MKYTTEYYKYDQLPTGSIRLLVVHGTGPKTQGDLAPEAYAEHYLECQLAVSLKSFELSQCPPYLALSYTWGHPGGLVEEEPSILTAVQRIYPIYCDGMIIRGTWNLRAALRRVRYAMKLQEYANLHDHYVTATQESLQGAIYLWVDALCINQDDLDERATQVQTMGQIYKRAQRTILWLGEADEYTDDALRVFQRMTDKIAEASRLVTKSGTSTLIESTPLPDAELHACRAFLNRNWFTRNWVVQEVLLSQSAHVWVGNTASEYVIWEYAGTFKQLTYFSSAMMGNDTPVRADAQALLQRATDSVSFLSSSGRIRQRMRVEGLLPSFISVMNMCRLHKCSDPRDKVYSVLAVCSEVSADPSNTIVPDYNKDVKQVFVETTKLIIHHRQDLWILSLVMVDDFSGIEKIKRLETLPTWCPDYRSIHSTANSAFLQHDPWRLPAIEGRDAPPLRVVNLALQAYGQCIGYVADKAARRPSASFWRLFEVPSICSLLTAVDTDAKSELRVQLQNKTRVELLWRTILPLCRSVFNTFLDLKPEEEQLPSSLGLFLPMILRQILYRYLTVRKHLESASTTDQLARDFVQYGSTYERILSRLRTLEPENAHFLPDFGQVTQISSGFHTDEPGVLTAKLAMDQADLEAWVERAEDLQLETPDQIVKALKKRFTLDNNANSLRIFENDEDVINWTSALAEKLHGLHVYEAFRTDNHLFGVACCVLQPGDQLWILHGAHALMLLRSLPNGNYCYLGETYMYGLMDGEVVPFCRNPISISIE